MDPVNRYKKSNRLNRGILMYYWIALILSLCAGNSILATIFLAFFGRLYIIYWIIIKSEIIPWIQTHWMG